MSTLQALSNPMKKHVKRLFRQFGLEIHRVSPLEPYAWLREGGVRTILDIGANVGQFAAQIHGLIPDAVLYSFEPLRDCYQQLLDRMRGIKDFHAFNVALGDASGQEQIFRNDYTPSSSILPVDELLAESFPFAASATPEEIEIRRLDDLADELSLTKPILMKIDVQGMEDRVILGAERVLAQTSIVLVETSFRHLYKGQALFDRVYRLLCDRGFTFMGNEHSLRSPVDGRVLQADSVFVRHSDVQAKPSLPAHGSEG